MIEINLLPEELRQDNRDTSRLQPIYILYGFYILLAILIFLHSLFLFMGVGKAIRLSLLNKKWSLLSDKIKVLEQSRKEYLQETESNKKIKEILANRINVAEKLNRLSLDLPPGIWFNSLNFEKDTLLIGASVISLEKKEMTLINKFIETLRNDKIFTKNFKRIELGPLQTKDIAGYEVLDFSLRIENK